MCSSDLTMLVSAAISFILLATASAIPTQLSQLEKREDLQVIADGKRVHVGQLPTWDFIYRSAGYLARGGCPLSEVGIKLCYQYKLSDNPNKNIDPGESSGGNKVQTVILNSPSYPATGSVVQFNFKLRVDAALTSTSPNSFPLVQIVSKEVDNGPSSAVYFDLRNNLAGIYAFTDTSTPAVSVPLGQFTGKTTFHTWTVKGGPNGYADIRILESGSGATILHYRADGQNSRDSYRIRIGAVRLAEDLKPLHAYFGDWSATPLQA